MRGGGGIRSRIIFNSELLQGIWRYVMSNESTSYRKHVKEIERFDINSRWRKLLVDKIKESINEIEEPEEIPDVLDDWNWMRSKQRDFILEVIRALSRLKAATIRRIIHKIIRSRDMWMDYSDMEESDAVRYYDNLRKKVTGAVESLDECGLLQTTKISKAEVGKGKRAVTIYAVLYAKEKDIYKAKHRYLVIGGAPGENPPKEPKKPQSPEKNARWSLLRKYQSWKDDAFKEASTYSYTKCPNDCNGSHQRYKQEEFKAMVNYKGIITLTCKTCNKNIILTNPVDYTRNKFESIYPYKIDDLKKEFGEKEEK